GIPKAILSDPATVERVVLGQTIAERFPDGPRVEKRERILLSVELIGDKLAVDARVLDAEVDLAQVNVFTAEPGFEASNSLFCIVKRLRRRSGNPRFHQIGGRETLCCRVDSDVNGRRHDTQSCPAVRWVTELAPLITHGLNVYIASGTRGTGSLSGCRLEGLERAIDLCRSSYPNRQGEHSCGASFPQAASPSAPKGALSSPWKTPPIHSRSLTEGAAAGRDRRIPIGQLGCPPKLRRPMVQVGMSTIRAIRWRSFGRGLRPLPQDDVELNTQHSPNQPRPAPCISSSVSPSISSNTMRLGNLEHDIFP